MKLDLSWSELARAAGGRLTQGDPAARVDVVCTDTRTLREGSAFWALVGKRVDAHELLGSHELAAKAAGWVVSAGRLKTGGPRPAQLVEVADTLKALQVLAHFHRKRFDIPVVGIAGSNGKTTTKEMLRCVCAQVGPACASPGNWNNEVGVPLSVLELTPGHRYGLFELAACRPGEIGELASIAQPTAGLLTNIGPDHLESFGTIDVSFQTNSELLAALPEDGAAIINLDDPWLAGLETRLGSRAVTYGRSARCRVRIEGRDALVIDRHRIAVKLRSFGAYNRYNAAAAAAAAWAMGLSPELIRAGLEAHAPAMLRQELQTHPSGAAIVLDAYNANPASMRASVEAFCEEFAGRPRTLVLGDMKELGPDSSRFHRELGEWLAGLELKAVFLAGPEMGPAAAALEAAKPRFLVEHSLDPGGLASALRAALAPRDALLFKASRAMRLEELARLL